MYLHFTKRQDYDNIFYKNVSLAGGYLYGIEQNYLDTCDFILREGRGFDKEDYKKQRKVALLDSDSSRHCFRESQQSEKRSRSKESHMWLSVL